LAGLFNYFRKDIINSEERAFLSKFMIIFLYGADTFRLKQKQNEIIESYKEKNKNGLGLIFFAGDKLEYKDLKGQVETNSMFKEKKLIVLRDIFSDKNFKEEFLKNIDIFLDSDDLILVAETNDIDKRDALYKSLQKKAKNQEFPPLSGEKLAAWIKNEFRKYKTQPESRVIEKIMFFVGNDIWQLENEIKKLVCHAGGKKISENDVALLIRPKIENDIFKTIDSLTSGKKDEALYLIHRHLERGDSPLYLLSMINFQFRNLLEVKDLMEKNTPYYGIVKKSGLHPFVVRKTYAQAQRFTLLKLKKIYQKIFQADLSIKTGKIDPQNALDLLIASV
jgi:DNA polymerase-3 subunit delta